eukprot:TRINITY_DN4193_c0_g1_i1.p1 TRINITY_DN4193_c0_g1~~TRINITY_DN4193_c0_g1_i1.p1  ORF type:complete len:261 (+),score=45.16 TRINITY_DN4193_c0_g1_i1:36-785(+)
MEILTNTESRLPSSDGPATSRDVSLPLLSAVAVGVDDEPQAQCQLLHVHPYLSTAFYEIRIVDRKTRWRILRRFSWVLKLRERCMADGFVLNSIPPKKSYSITNSNSDVAALAEARGPQVIVCLNEILHHADIMKKKYALGFFLPCRKFCLHSLRSSNFFIFRSYSTTVSPFIDPVDPDQDSLAYYFSHFNSDEETVSSLQELIDDLSDHTEGEKTGIKVSLYTLFKKPKLTPLETLVRQGLAWRLKQL